MAFYKCDKKQNVGTGFKVDDVSNFTAVADSSDAKVTLSWTDPDDFEIEGTVQAKWAGTVIVRKAYSEPKSTGDGTIVLNSTVKNQYSVNGFVDENVYLGTTYYYRAFPYTTDGVTTVGSSVSVETAAAPIYGAEWDGTASSAWTRTDRAAEFEDPNPYYEGMTSTPSSPFDNIMPWSGMQVVEDAEAGTLVSIPKYWYKWTRDGAKMKLQIANVPEPGFLVSPAHADRGDGKGERDVVYVGAYHCGFEVYGQPQYKSLTNAWPQSNETRASFRTNIHNLGANIWQYDFAMYWTIMMLYLVEYADWNSQAKIGYGCSTNGEIEQSGACDDMVYHTGTNAANRTTYGHTRYRYIEDLWGNIVDFVDGIYFSGNDIYCTKNPNEFYESDYGTLVGVRAVRTGSGKFVVTEWTNPSVPGFEYALYPSNLTQIYDVMTDIYTIYSCDEYTSGNNNGVGTGVVLAIGGANAKFQEFGAFDFVGDLTASDTTNRFGCRLMKLS